MRLLMLSTDKNILISGSESQRRMMDYGGLVEELHIIVKSQISNLKSQKFGNVFIFPTGNRFKLGYFRSAYKIAKEIIVNCELKIENCVVTTQDPFETGLVGWLLKIRFKLPLQIQVHTDFLSPYFAKESIKNKIRVILGKYLVKRADGIRVVSERVKKSLVTSHLARAGKISVLPIVYDMNRFNVSQVRTDLHLKYPGYGFIILAASRLTKEKNVGLAIKAMAEVVKSFPRTLLLVVGHGPESKNLQLTTYNLQLGNNVIFEPWTSDIVSYYKTADTFALTSNYEGGARAPAEAVAAARPVVMTDVPPAGETVIDGKNGFVVAVNDHRQLAGKLIELISDPDRQGMFSRQSLAIAKGFITKEDYLKLYYQALASVQFKSS